MIPVREEEQRELVFVPWASAMNRHQPRILAQAPLQSEYQMPFFP